MKEVTAGQNFTDKQVQELFAKSIAEVLKNNSDPKTADGSERKDPRTAKPDDILIADDFPYW